IPDGEHHFGRTRGPFPPHHSDDVQLRIFLTRHIGGDSLHVDQRKSHHSLTSTVKPVILSCRHPRRRRRQASNRDANGTNAKAEEAPVADATEVPTRAKPFHVRTATVRAATTEGHQNRPLHGALKVYLDRLMSSTQVTFT